MPRKLKKPNSELGYRLAKMRLENNMTVAKLGEKLGRDKATISRYESEGKVDAETILAYCKEFGVDPNYILGWEVLPKKEWLAREEEFLRLLVALGKLIWTDMHR